MCQFSNGCTRPVCFFAHNESQLRHTGVPGGPQPIVAPPEPIVGGPAAPPPPGPRRGGGPDHTLLNSISDAALQMQQLQDAVAAGSGPLRGGSGVPGGRGMGIPEHAISDVLPIGGGVPSARTGRGAGAAFGAHAPPGGLKSTPLPRGDWGGPDSAVLQAAIAAQQAAFGAAAASGELPSLDAAAAIAFAHAQIAQVGAAETRGRDLRRSISEAASFAAGLPQHLPPSLQHSATLDMQSLLAAASAAMAVPASLNGMALPPGVGHAAVPPPPPAAPAATSGLLEQLSRQLASVQLSGAVDAAAAALALSAPAAAASNSAPLPPVQLPTSRPLLSHRSDAAAFAAALQQEQGSSRAPLAPLAPLGGAAAASGSGTSSPASAPLAGVAVGSRTGSPGSGRGIETLLVVGDEGLTIDRLQEQLSDAPRPGSRGARDAGGAVPAPPAGKGATGAGGNGSQPLGREAAAQLLAQMPESAVRDLLRVLGAGQAAVSQPAA
jgi:hypothetical protein